MRKPLKVDGDLKEIKEAQKTKKGAREWERLQAIRLAISGEYTAEEIAQAVGRARSAIWRWVGAYRKGGIQGLLSRKTAPGSKPELGSQEIERIREGLVAGEWRTASQLWQFLKKEYGVQMGINGIYYWLGKLGGVLKVPRKTHIRKNEAEGKVFREQLAEKLQALQIAKGRKIRIWVVDEGRHGLISVIRKVWTLKGYKPTAPYQTKYQWGYLYAALEVEGKHDAQFLYTDSVNLQMSEAFLRQIAQSEQEAEHIILWDRAGFHQKPEIHSLPERVHLLALPAYSPELNPVEKLFDQIKDYIGNQIFPSIDALRKKITDFLQPFWSLPKIVQSLIGPDNWLSSQVNFSSNPISPTFN